MHAQPDLAFSPRTVTEEKKSNEEKREKKVEAAAAPAPAPAPTPVASETPAAPTSAPAPSPSSSSPSQPSTTSDTAKLENEIRGLRRELADAVSAKVEALNKVRDLERAVHEAEESAQADIRKLEREVAQLKKDLAAARAAAPAASDAGSATAASGSTPSLKVTDDVDQGSDDEKAAGEGGARLTNLTSGRAAPSKRKPATRRPVVRVLPFIPVSLCTCVGPLICHR